MLQNCLGIPTIQRFWKAVGEDLMEDEHRVQDHTGQARPKDKKLEEIKWQH